ncbi:hypothetical protein MHYP_G00361740 [Metynnis hypsauchen]
MRHEVSDTSTPTALNPSSRPLALSEKCAVPVRYHIYVKWLKRRILSFDSLDLHPVSPHLNPEKPAQFTSCQLEALAGTPKVMAELSPFFLDIGKGSSHFSDFRVHDSKPTNLAPKRYLDHGESLIDQKIKDLNIFFPFTAQAALLSTPFPVSLFSLTAPRQFQLVNTETSSLRKPPSLTHRLI